MSNFKNIEKLGLHPIYMNGLHPFVSAEDLELVLQSARVVYGVKGSWTTTQCENDKFTGLLIGITPLKKKTKAEAALELLERLESMSGIFNVAWPKDDMKRILEMKDEV